jgi:hypothetical protein
LCAASKRRFRRDEGGVTEVLSFLFGFLMAVMILIVTLYAFGQVNQSARHLGAQAELREVVNRVALGVQEALQVAAARNDSRPTAETFQLRFEREISVPSTVQGYGYDVTLDPNFVVGRASQPKLEVHAPTFNAQVSMPANPADCAARHVVCALSGVADGRNGRIVMSYFFEWDGSTSYTNEITIRST